MRNIEEKFKFFNTGLEILKERVEHLESYEDEEEEEVEHVGTLDKASKKYNEEYVEELAQIFIKNSLDILDDMENDIKKNACQKDIKERSMLYWNKMEKELKNLYPLAFDRDHFFKVEVDEMKLVLSEIEKSGTKFDKDDCLESVNCFKTRLTKIV